MIPDQEGPSTWVGRANIIRDRYTKMQCTVRIGILGPAETIKELLLPGTPLF
jgi:hypothetical protein